MDLNMSAKQVFLAALLAGLGWTLGIFAGQFLQYLLTNLVLNPLIRLVMGL